MARGFSFGFLQVRTSLDQNPAVIGLPYLTPQFTLTLAHTLLSSNNDELFIYTFSS